MTPPHSRQPSRPMGEYMSAATLLAEAPALVAKAIKYGWMKHGRPLTDKEQEAAMQGRFLKGN